MANKKSTDKKVTETNKTTSSKKKTTTGTSPKSSNKKETVKTSSNKKVTKDNVVAKEETPAKETKEESKATKGTKKVANKKGTSETKAVNVEKKKESKKKDSKEAVVSEKESKITVPSVDSEQRIKKVITIIVVSIVLVAAAYLLAQLIIDKRNDGQDDSSAEAVIQYDQIMIGSTLAQYRDEYYVLISSSDDPSASVYSSYAQSYSRKENSLKVYLADYDEGYNKRYIGETSNLLVSNISELKITGSTLLKVQNKKVVAAYEGTQIAEAFKELLK